MPRYTWMPQKVAGIEMHEFGKLYDGNGNEIPEDVFFFDTDTGQVVYFVRNSSDKHVVDESIGEFYSLTAWYKPPLRFAPFDPDNDPQPTFVVNVK